LSVAVFSPELGAASLPPSEGSMPSFDIVVEDPDGQPVPGLRVSVEDPEGYGAEAVTDPAGRVRLASRYATVTLYVEREHRGSLRPGRRVVTVG